jgi:hypothetical protein
MKLTNAKTYNTFRICVNHSFRVFKEGTSAKCIENRLSKAGRA